MKNVRTVLSLIPISHMVYDKKLATYVYLECALKYLLNLRLLLFRSGFILFASCCKVRVNTE